MSRVDVPTLRCDRCEVETRDLSKMGRFSTLTHYHVSGKSEWDLCPTCWAAFQNFVGAEANQ